MCISIDGRPIETEVEPTPIDEEEVIRVLSDLYLQDLAYFAEEDPKAFSSLLFLCANCPNKTISFYEMKATSLFSIFDHATSHLRHDSGYIVMVHGSEKRVNNILNRIEELHKTREKL